MEKIIKRTISLTTKKRDSRNKLFEEFYSHDKNNAIFEFTVEDGIPTENIVVLFHFKRTNRHLEVRGRVDNDKIIVNFDTSLIIKDEQVAGYIYYENGEKSNDVYRFMFDVYVSEIDKERNLPVMEQESKRIVPLTDIVTKSEITELLKKIVANERLYDDAEIRSKIGNKADTQTVEAIARRVETLENNSGNNTVNDDNDVINRLNALENNASRYLIEHQPLTSIEESIRQIDQRFNNLSNIYLTSHQSLEHLATNDTLDKIERRVEQLEQTRGSQPIVDTQNLATNAKVEAVEERVQALENRPIVDTSEFAKKKDIPQAYNDNELSRRISALESKPDIEVDKIVTKEVLESKGYLTAESLTTINRTIGEQNTKITALQSKAEFEIHGTGMPNGRVTAPIGTTYVDTEVTNGALKWIKETGNGNTGWKVFTGDTGWRTLPLVNKRGNAKLQVRRINDEVIVKFDGLQWGWFGVDDISKQGGRIVDKTIAGKKYTWIKLDIGKGNDVLPQGFRSASSLLSGLYGDLGDLLGSVYVGGTADSNAIQLRYAMERNELTSNILSQIRISPITFITDDDYPITLP